MSNTADIRATVLRLEEYHRTGKVSKRATRKLTAVLSQEQYDLLTRLAILENDTKTGVIRRALDYYAEYLGDENLYPFEV